MEQHIKNNIILLGSHNFTSTDCSVQRKRERERERERGELSMQLLFKFEPIQQFAWRSYLMSKLTNYWTNAFFFFRNNYWTNVKSAIKKIKFKINWPTNIFN